MSENDNKGNEVSETAARFAVMAENLADAEAGHPAEIVGDPTPVVIQEVIMTVPETAAMVAVAGGTEGAGALVWLEQAGPTNVADLCAARDAAGLNAESMPLPKAPSAVDALSRTAKAWETSARDVKVGKRGARNRGGVYHLATTEVSADGAKYSAAWVLSLAGGDLKVEIQTPEGRVDADPTNPEVIQFRRDFADFRANFASPDITAWFSSMVEKLDATPIKARGTDYFIPPAGLDTFRRWSEVLSLVGHTVSEIAVMRQAKAIEAVFRAIVREATDTLQEVEDALSAPREAGQRGMNDRGLRTRIQICERAQKKLRAYEEITGMDLSDLHNRASELRGRLMRYDSDAAQRGANLDLESGNLKIPEGYKLVKIEDAPAPLAATFLEV